MGSFASKLKHIFGNNNEQVNQPPESSPQQRNNNRVDSIRIIPFNNNDPPPAPNPKEEDTKDPLQEINNREDWRAITQTSGIPVEKQRQSAKILVQVLQFQEQLNTPEKHQWISKSFQDTEAPPNFNINSNTENTSDENSLVVKKAPAPRVPQKPENMTASKLVLKNLGNDFDSINLTPNELPRPKPKPEKLRTMSKKQLSEKYKSEEEQMNEIFGDDQPSVPRAISQNHTRLEELVSPGNPEEIFRDLRKIGAGGSSTVYCCTNPDFESDPSQPSKVAIKKITLSQQPSLSTVYNELKILQDTSHPNIANLINSYLWNDVLWVVIEFVKGTNLAELLAFHHKKSGKNPPLSEPEIAQIGFQICQGIKHLHQRNIIHRDIKSDNILLGSQGEIKITDFGYSTKLTKEINKRQTVVGTTYWMAPEVITSSARYDFSVDVWSLGVLFFECVAVDPPYFDVPTIQALFLIATEGLPKMHHQDNISPEFRNLIESCTKLQPSQRLSVGKILEHPFFSCQSGAKAVIKRICELEGK